MFVPRLRMMLLREWRLRIFACTKLRCAVFLLGTLASVIGVYAGLNPALLRGSGFGAVAPNILRDFVDHGSLLLPRDAAVTRRRLKV